MKVYILGICGTFMAGVAMLARELGHEVVGSDANVYPPMSTQLEQAGILIREGYLSETLDRDADLYVIGNAMSRGNPQVEIILNENLPYVSGPQWLGEHLLRERWVLAVAGTHGKTTTTSMLAWILDYAGLKPGFLIGGVCQNFNHSARLGDSPFFVIEADEYDTAFFDKRSKFVHYHPRTLILNNLEFDHADIFEDLAAIQKQFHHLVRIVPQNGLIIRNAESQALATVIEKGCWSEQSQFASHNGNTFPTRSDFVLNASESQLLDVAKQQHYPLNLPSAGRFNLLNACAAIIAAQHAGVPIDVAVQALKEFQGVKRRQELVLSINGIRLIDDFAHHPTAIQETLKALRQQTSGKLLCLFEPRSNTMKLGTHKAELFQSFADADQVMLYDNGSARWNIEAQVNDAASQFQRFTSIDELIAQAVETARPDDVLVMMSNGSFDGLRAALGTALQQRFA